MWPLLTDEDLWQGVTQSLRTVVDRLLVDAAVWLTVLPPVPSGHAPTPSASDRMARLQARLSAVPWTVWSTPETRQAWWPSKRVASCTARCCKGVCWAGSRTCNASIL